MPHWTRIGGATSDKVVVATVKFKAPRSLTLGRSFTMNPSGRYAIEAGHFIARNGNDFRILPRANVTTAFATNATTGVVDNYQPFVAGDKLYMLEPFATLTLAGTWAATDVITATINGVSDTMAADDTVLADIAVNLAAWINANPLFNKIVRAVAVDAVVYVFAKDMKSLYAISASDNGAGSITASAAALARATAAIGTIASIAPSTKTITLTGNAGIAVPAGAKIGVPVDEILGIHIHSVDLQLSPTRDINAVTQADIYKQCLPYWDDSIGMEPGLQYTFVDKL